MVQGIVHQCLQREDMRNGDHIPAVPAIENSLAVPEHTTVKTLQAMSPENEAHYELEKEAIHLILIRIGDEIYSTVDACKTDQEMWEAIKWLQQGESLNIQDNVDTTPRYKNDNQSGQFGSQRTVNVVEARENVDSTHHREKMLLCKQAEKGVPLKAKQSDWLADTDKEID
uniref:Uncharacterized protein n=1 Tax=Tanacetum cinerariifolium TaxID=118510 RepID=A0A699H286_TANCI|nr:hypothetical protein [Tanacetum cinerariifolium]